MKTPCLLSIAILTSFVTLCQAQQADSTAPATAGTADIAEQESDPDEAMQIAEVDEVSQNSMIGYWTSDLRPQGRP